MSFFSQKFKPTRDKRKNCGQFSYEVPSISTCMIRTNHETVFKSPGWARAHIQIQNSVIINHSVCEGFRESTPFLLRTVMLTLGEYCSFTSVQFVLPSSPRHKKILLANIQEYLATRKQTRKVGRKFFSVFEARSAKLLFIS